MKKSTKLLVLLLSLALICAGLVIATSADTSEADTVSYVVAGETVKGTLADAVANADAGTTVTLLGNCTVAEAIAVTKTVTVDLNGYTLTTTGANAFNVSGATTVFTVTGTGNITAAGVLATATEDGATINVVGTGVDGITVTHSGSKSTQFMNIKTNTLRLENLTVTAKKGAKNNSFVQLGGNADITVKKTSINLDFNNTNGWTGEFYTFTRLQGTAHLTFEDSAFYSRNPFVEISYISNGTNESISVKNSVIRVNDNDSTYNGARLSIFYVGKEGATGTINVHDSLLECAGRMFASEIDNTAVVGNVYGSTLKVMWSTKDLIKNANAGNINRRFEAVNLYNSENGNPCKVILIDNTTTQTKGGGVRAMEPGVRTNNVSVTTSKSIESGIQVPGAVDENGKVTSWIYAATSTTDAYVWVYDPVGDIDAPYVLVDTTKTDVTVPDYYANFSFDTIRFNQSASGHAMDMAITKENAALSYGDVEKHNDNLQFFTSRGTLYAALETGNAYLKYVVTPYDDNKYTITNDAGETVKITAKDIYGSSYDGTTRNFNTEVGKDKGAQADPFFILGKNTDAAAVIANTGYTSKKVIVSEFDFGSDSDIGFPSINLSIQTRSGGTNNALNGHRLSISNAGNITNTLIDAPADAYTQLNLNEWYRVSVVCYTATNEIHFFINGVYMGKAQGYKDGTAVDENLYFQGVRINVNKTSKHQVGSSFALDNLSTRSFADYQYDEVTYTADSAYNYITTSSPRKYMHDALTVNGRPMADMAAAVAAANATDSKIVVKANVTLGDVTENVTIDLAKTKATFGDDSFGFVKNGTNYTFNKNYWYNAYKFTGDINKLMDGTYDESDFTLVSKVKLGHEFNIENFYTDRVENFVNLTVDTQNGWIYDMEATESVLPKAPDLSDLALADDDKNVYYLPLLEAVPMAHVVKDAAGNILSYGLNNDDTNNAFRNLVSGTTLVLLQDYTVVGGSDHYIRIKNDDPIVTADGVKTVNGVVIDNDYTDEEIAAMRQVATDFKIDLNGNALNLGEYRIVIGQNIEYSVYSSKPGATVNMVTYNGSKIVGARSFNMMYNDGTTSWYEKYDDMLMNMNSRFNFGTYTDRNGDEVKSEMFTMTGAVVFEAVSADSSCSFNVNNVSAARVTNDSNGLIVSRYFDGKFNVTNSIFTTIATGSNAYTMVHIMRPDYTTSNKPDPAELVFNPEIVFEDCMFLNTSPTQNAVNNGGNTTDNSKNIIFRNCISNTRLNAADRAHVYFGEGTSSQNMLVGGQYETEGLIEAYCWEPMTTEAFANEGDYFVKVLKPVYDATAKKINYTAYYFVNNGYGEKFAAEYPGATYYELPLLTTKVVKQEDAVRVSYSRLDGSEAIYAYYVKGADVQTRFVGSDRKSVNNWDLKAEYHVYNANAVTLTYTGWEALPTNVQEDVVIKPTYTVTPNVSGFKANLSLYADFNVNLYIPAAYAEYAKVYVLGNAVDTNAATVGDAEYLMATVSQKCNMAADSIVFTIKLAETVDGKVCEATATVTISIASYANAVLAGEIFTDADKVLMYYMLNYANEAETYFDGAADETVTALLSEYAAYGAMYGADYTYGTTVDTADLSAAFDNATLDIESTPAFVLTLKNGFEGTVTVSYANGLNVRNYTVAADDSRTIVVDGMKMYNFGTILTISANGTVNGEAVSVEGKYTLDTFANYHYNNSMNEESETKAASEACMPLVKALVAYAEVAELYKTGALAGALVTE